MTLLELHWDTMPPGATHIDEMRPYVSPRAPGRYWHQPRSACRLADGQISVTFWCGGGRRAVDADFTDDTPVELRCGTCVGRRLGYDAEHGTVFRPRDHWQLPTRCPGTGFDAELRHCDACGEHVSAARGWNASGSAQHRPGSGLARRWTPCDYHGWREMRMRGDELVCCSWSCRPYEPPPSPRPLDDRYPAFAGRDDPLLIPDETDIPITRRAPLPGIRVR